MMSPTLPTGLISGFQCGATYEFPLYTVVSTGATYITVDQAWWGYDDLKLTLKQAVAHGIAMREIWISQWRKMVDPVFPKLQAMALTLRRAPARKCVKDARRWKRRRFLQRLAA